MSVLGPVFTGDFTLFHQFIDLRGGQSLIEEHDGEGKTGGKFPDHCGAGAVFAIEEEGEPDHKGLIGPNLASCASTIWADSSDRFPGA